MRVVYPSRPGGIPYRNYGRLKKSVRRSIRPKERKKLRRQIDEKRVTGSVIREWQGEEIIENPLLTGEEDE